MPFFTITLAPETLEGRSRALKTCAIA